MGDVQFRVLSNRRDDIQGLRALAVLSVVGYHLKIWPFTGGFVGVDVFFVISGYLITKMILGDIQAGSFSLSRFYMRRARRLLPAFLATIIAVFATGSLLLDPETFKRLSASSIAAVLWASNVAFWLEAGYFDADAIRKPLLHTWSLAVEKQFYLVWPFVLMATAATCCWSLHPRTTIRRIN